ncbi:MAG: hypothetical protein KY464_09420 [Gemmatimonadetes bacterium]|nr:hypothetical protein [Gemmatimonadota bacterium]
MRAINAAIVMAKVGLIAIAAPVLAQDSAQVSPNRFVTLYEDPNVTVTVDARSFQRDVEPGVHVGWFFQTHTEPVAQFRSYDSVRYQSKVDCNQRRGQILMQRFTLRGSLVWTDNRPAAWTTPEPGTVSEAVIDNLCSALS